MPSPIHPARDELEVALSVLADMLLLGILREVERVSLGGEPPNRSKTSLRMSGIDILVKIRL